MKMQESDKRTRLSVIRYTPEWSPAVAAMNARLLKGGLDPELVFPSEPKAEFGTSSDAPIYQEFFLVAAGADVRGGYFLTYEPWWIKGGIHYVANYRLPLAESKHSLVKTLIYRDAVQRQPLLYCLGMGSYDRPLPKLLRNQKWPMFSTPFFFRAVRGGRVLRNLRSVRKDTKRRLLFDMAAFTGAASVGFALVHRMQSRGVQGYIAHPVSRFGPWTDDLWHRAKQQYFLAAVRTAEMLRIRFPEEDERFLRLRIERDGRTVGWVVLLDTQMRGHKHFGDLRVGTIVDGFAAEEHVNGVFQAAASVLQQRGVDLIVTNQCHSAWMEACRRTGFLEGPSNRIFAVSPELGQLLAPFEENRGGMHLTRGDGAGPIHL